MRPPHDPAGAAAAPLGALPDHALFEAAVRMETNAARAATGLAPLSPDAGLTTAAAMQAVDMARLGFFDHVSSDPARRGLHDRYAEAGVAWRRAGENIAKMSVMAFADRPFHVVDEATAHYTLSPGGAPVPRHSYESLAAETVARWLASPGHRANILDPGFARHGAGLAIDPAGPNAGWVLIAQTFAEGS